MFWPRPNLIPQGLTVSALALHHQKGKVQKMSQPKYRYLVVSTNREVEPPARAAGEVDCQPVYIREVEELTVEGVFDSEDQAKRHAREQALGAPDQEFRVYELGARFLSVQSVQQL